MPITFTRTVQGSYDPETEVATETTTTIVGPAIRVRGDPNRYLALGLVESKAPTLYFVPTTYGQTPAPGDTVTWESQEYSVKDVLPLAPDGVTISARIIIGKA